MNEEPTVREVIRARLASGALTRERPRPHPPDAHVTIGTGPGGNCDGCTKPIGGQDGYLMFHFPSGPTIRFHDACERMWDEERHRSLPPSAT